MCLRFKVFGDCLALFGWVQLQWSQSGLYWDGTWGVKREARKKNSTPDSMPSRTRLGGKGALHSEGGGNFCENEGMNGGRREGGGAGPALMI